MNIGTPLAKNSLKVMLLGSGELGKEVIIALQRFGVEVIAVDRYSNAPGQQVAHRSYVINMADAEALRTLVETECPDIIVPEIEAIATDELVKIEQEGLATVIPCARAVRLTMNREGIRCLAAETLGIPTSAYAFAESLTELRDHIDNTVHYPCIVKPVMSSSGKGQSLLESSADIESAWEYAKRGGRVETTRVIVEEKIDFDYEITLLTVRSLNSDGQEITDFCAPIGHVQQGGDYIESWQPQQMKETVLARAKDVARIITENLGGLGVFGVELFIRGEDVFFSEVSPRPHDTGMVTMVSQIQNEFELHARAILGLPVSVAMRTTEPFAAASAVIYGNMNESGVAYENIAQALSIPCTDLRLFGKPDAYEKRRMGVTLATATDTDQARRRAKKSASLVKVVPAGC